MRWCRSAAWLGLLALELLVLLRTDLIDSWRQATPPDAPNRFVIINIQPDRSAPSSKPPTRVCAGTTGIPMIRRPVAVNGQPIAPESYTEDRAGARSSGNSTRRTPSSPRNNEVAAYCWTPGDRRRQRGRRPRQHPGPGNQRHPAFDMAGVLHEVVSSPRCARWISLDARQLLRQRSRWTTWTTWQ